MRKTPLKAYIDPNNKELLEQFASVQGMSVSHLLNLIIRDYNMEQTKNILLEQARRYNEKRD